jgi:hypothetical protein
MHGVKRVPVSQRDEKYIAKEAVSIFVCRSFSIMCVCVSVCVLFISSCTCACVC